MKKTIIYSLALALTITSYACNDSGNGESTSTDTSNTAADSMSRNNSFQPADTTASDTTKRQ